MKIAHIALSGTFTEGFNYHENELSQAQKNIEGNDVFVIARNSKRAGKDIVYCEPETKTMSNGVRLFRVKMKFSRHNVFTKPVNPNDVLRILDDEKPDLIWVHGVTNNSLSIVAKYKKKNHVVVFADNHVDEGNFKMAFPRTLILDLYKLRNRRLAKYVDMFYGVTPGRVTFMNRYLGVPKSKSKLSIMGANSSLIPFSDKETIRRDIRKVYSIPDDAFVFVSGGNLNNAKKTLELIEAFIKGADAKSRLLLFGSVDNAIKDRFDQLVASDDRVIYAGWKDSIGCNRLFLASDCAVFPRSHSTLWENSLACGTVSVFGQKDGLDHLFVSHGRYLDCGVEENLIGFFKTFSQSGEYRTLRSKADEGRSSYFYENIAKEIYDDYLNVIMGAKNG